jgi:hypothetical protein
VSIHNPIPTFKTYKVEPDSKITVSVLIGDAQMGGWAMGFDPDGAKKGSDSTPVAIGTGVEVKGRILQVVVTAVDVNPLTNRLSAVVTVSGGPGGPLTVTQSYDGGATGDTALLTTLVDFE